MKERLKELRKILGFKTQKDFSDDLGIPFSNVSSYEAGRRTPSDGVIALICQKYGVDEKWLRTGEGDPQKKEDIEFSNICASISTDDIKAKEAIMKYYQLSREDKELFWKFMERFIK